MSSVNSCNFWLNTLDTKSDLSNPSVRPSYLFGRLLMMSGHLRMQVNVMKKISFTVLPKYTRCVLVVLVYVARATLKPRRSNNVSNPTFTNSPARNLGWRDGSSNCNRNHQSIGHDTLGRTGRTA